VVDFCPDSELGYVRSSTRFVSGQGLLLDESYRLTHLPLIAPDHADVIRSLAGKGYVMGRHQRVFSLVLPLPVEALERSSPYRELEEELGRSLFASKIAWNLLPKRREKIHVTVCGSLSTETPRTLSGQDRQALKRFGGVRVQLRGLFSGNVNVGRLYLRAYPECRNGVNQLREMQRTLGRPETDLYVAGIFNLIDHLDVDEANALKEIIERWWDRPILTFDADQLWHLGAHDDLVLDAAIEEAIPLTGG